MHIRRVSLLPALLLGIGAAVSLLPIAAVPTPVQERTLTFSNLEWTVKTGGGRRVGPGPNFFSDREENVWVDATGALHLRITRHSGNWQCAEVVSRRSFGWGTYLFQVEAVRNLGPTVVGGLFTWDNTDPAYAHRELDFEYGLWSKPQAPNFQAVVQPYTRPGRMVRYAVPLDEPLTHSFRWQPDGIRFCSARGYTEHPEDSLLRPGWTFTGPERPRPGREQVRVNLWLFQGTPPPEGGAPELIIRKFLFRKEAP